MAGLAHLGIGLAAVLLAPDIHVLILIFCSYFIDIVFFGFMFTGLENMPTKVRPSDAPWSHSLFMAVIWSILVGGVAMFFTQDTYIMIILGLLVFSHWVVDFIVSPMTYAFPKDTGKLLHPFGGSAKVGLGVMRTKIGVVVVEGGTTFLGFVIFVLTWL